MFFFLFVPLLRNTRTPSKAAVKDEENEPLVQLGLTLALTNIFAPASAIVSCLSWVRRAMRGLESGLFCSTDGTDAVKKQ